MKHNQLGMSLVSTMVALAIHSVVLYVTFGFVGKFNKTYSFFSKNIELRSLRTYLKVKTDCQLSRIDTCSADSDLIDKNGRIVVSSTGSTQWQRLKLKAQCHSDGFRVLYKKLGQESWYTFKRDLLLCTS